MAPPLTWFEYTKLELRQASLTDDDRRAFDAHRTWMGDDAYRRNVLPQLTSAHRASLFDLSLLPDRMNGDFDPRAAFVNRPMGGEWRLTTAGERVVRLLTEDGETP